jgi:hypothetical protein
MASQHAAYPAASVQRRSSISAAPCGVLSNSGANQTPGLDAIMDSVPFARTSAARSRQTDGSPKRAEEQTTESAVSRSGWCTARCRPTAPPSETPA